MMTSTADRERLGSPDRFGYEWSTYTEVMPEHRVQLQRWLGSTPLESFKGKRVLDVGCGMGRNPYWYAKEGASRVVGVDVDDGSLASARRNLGPLANAEVRKLSAYDVSPEALDGAFDVVTCVGVLHHLAEPETALRSMWSCVAPGGSLELWCYGRHGNRLMLPAIQACRAFGSRLPLPVAHVLAAGIAACTWPAFKLLPFRTEYYRNLRGLSFKNFESIVFDQMIPKIAHYWTREDLERLTAPLQGGKAMIELVQGNSWHVSVAKAK